LFSKIIKGENCTLVRFQDKDEKLVELIFKLFNEKETADFLNPEYVSNRARSKIRKWIIKKIQNPVDVWYVIKHKKKYIGYICFKWRAHYDEACEISTAIEKNYRGLRLGFESSKILVDYILSLKKFRYIVGYAHKQNFKAQNNLRKLGFRKAQRLQKIVSRRFYNDDGTSKTGSKYILFAIYTKIYSRKKLSL
jgi:RimJ/RimL family protein N-acetyltransferase